MRNRYDVDTTKGIVEIALIQRGEAEYLPTYVRLRHLDRLLAFDVRWGAIKHKHSNTFYAVAYVKEDGRRRSILLHRWLMNCYDWRVEHKDHDGLNNLDENLRVIHEYVTKLPEGVHFDSSRRKWFIVGRSQPWQGNKRPQRYFRTEEEALAAYQQWRRYWKEHTFI